MTLEKLKEWIKDKIVQYPEHKEEMLDLYSLCIDEIEQGGSPENEIYLCMSSIDDIIEGQND
jgi:hypothetical protein